MKLIKLYEQSEPTVKLLNLYLPVLSAFFLGLTLNSFFVVTTVFFLAFELRPGGSDIRRRKT